MLKKNATHIKKILLVCAASSFIFSCASGRVSDLAASGAGAAKDTRNAVADSADANKERESGELERAKETEAAVDAITATVEDAIRRAEERRSGVQGKTEYSSRDVEQLIEDIERYLSGVKSAGH